MAALDRQRIQEIIEALADRLDGEWLLIGGALVSLWLRPRRVTEDVDIIGLEGTQEQRFALLRAAADLGLPVEAVNSAADFFVQKIDGWKEDTQVFLRGKRGVILRPSPELFLLLKMRRLSAQDLDDCLALFDHVSTHGLDLDIARVAKAIEALDPTDDVALRERRQRLQQWLNDCSR